MLLCTITVVPKILVEKFSFSELKIEKVKFLKTQKQVTEVLSLYNTFFTVAAARRCPTKSVILKSLQTGGLQLY